MAREFNSVTDKDLIALLKNGAVGVLPTDTVYGLVCIAESVEAVRRLYSLKNREKKPGTIVAANIDQLVKLGFKYRYLKAIEEFWPNAISVEIPSSEPSTKYLRQGLARQAARIPNDKSLQKLMVETGPLLTSSANTPGQPPANNLEGAKDYFGDKVDFYVDGGDFTGRQPSTLIRVIDDAVEVLREGAVKINS